MLTLGSGAREAVCLLTLSDNRKKGESMRTKKPMILAVMTAIGLLLGLVTFGAGRTMAQVPTDTDGDGVPDGQDVCPISALNPTVVIDRCDSGVANTLFSTGCTLSDLLGQCAAKAKNHGKFVSCVTKLTNGLKRNKVLTGRQKGAIQSCAAQADIP